MERDMDLIRELLLRIASNPETTGMREFLYDTPEELGIHGYPVETVAYHIELLIEDGLIKGAITAGSPLHIIRRLTSRGHDFVDNIRDAGIWGKTKKRLSDLPGVSLAVIGKIAEAEILKHLGLT